MEEQFVTYENAVALKELGFDEPCFGYYVNGELRGVNLGVEELGGVEPYYQRLGFHTLSNHDILNSIKIVVTSPTFLQAFNWFRKEYQIYPEILTDCTTYPKFCFTYTRFLGNPNDLTEQEWGWENNIEEYSLLYKTYEEAESACIDKLIEIVKNI